MSAKRRRSTLDILIHCPNSHGVVPDQVHKQAEALHGLGIKVLVLSGAGYARTRTAEYPVLPCMAEGATTHNSGFFSRKVGKALQTVRNQLRFAWEVYRHRPALVLSGGHVDAQSPIWIWPHVLIVLLRRTVYATNLHFSTREHIIGPKWWNRLSATLAFKPYRIGVAHKRLAPPTKLPGYIRTVEVPIGPEKTTPLHENPKLIRKKWNVPRGKKVFLAFGTIRNHKNLDLAIRALLDNPDAYLVILGSVPSHKDRPMKYYEMLADDLGLSRRVHISEEFIPDEKRPSYFEAADFILLTYSAAYHSQASTLTTAVNTRRRVLASCGSSPMRDLIEHFGVGVFVPPDSSESVADGMATLLPGGLEEPDWEGYEDYATWETNVTRLLEAAADYIQGRHTHVRQFEEFGEQSSPLPKILNARRLAHPEKPPVEKKPPSKRKKAEPTKSNDHPASSARDDHHPEFPGFSTFSAAKATQSRNPAPEPAVNGHPLNGAKDSKATKLNGHAKKTRSTVPDSSPAPKTPRKRATTVKTAKPAAKPAAKTAAKRSRKAAPKTDTEDALVAAAI